MTVLAAEDFKARQDVAVLQTEIRNIHRSVEEVNKKVDQLSTDLKNHMAREDEENETIASRLNALEEHNRTEKKLREDRQRYIDEQTQKSEKRRSNRQFRTEILIGVVGLALAALQWGLS